MGFFLVKRIACGRLSVCRSVRRELVREELVVPLRKRVFLGFSLSRGARLARARADRAVLGLLVRRISKIVIVMALRS